MQFDENSESQFVDYTSATDYERFISSIENTLHRWNLKDQSFISANIPISSLTSAASDAKSINSSIPSSDRSISFRYRILQYEQPPLSGSIVFRKNSRTFLLFSCSHARPLDSNGQPMESHINRWQRGMEHFSPTMLSIANSTLYAKRTSDSGSFIDDSSNTIESEVGYKQEDWNVSQRQLATISRRLYKWFGVEDYILLLPIYPSSDTDLLEKDFEFELGKAAFTEDSLIQSMLSRTQLREIDTYEANQIQSAIMLALTNMNCTLPAFIPIGDIHLGRYIGVTVPGSSDCVALHFETQRAEQFYFPQTGISALLDFFKAKTSLSSSLYPIRPYIDRHETLRPSMQVSIWQKYKWTSDSQSEECVKETLHAKWRSAEWIARNEDRLYHWQLRMLLLFGDSLYKAPEIPYWRSSAMPIKSIEVRTAWKDLEEGTFVDNAVHSTLSSVHAHDWNIRFTFDAMRTENEQKPRLPLSKLLANLTQAYAKAKELAKDVLVTEVAPPLYLSSSWAIHDSLDPRDDSESGMRSISQSIPASRAVSLLGHAFSSLSSIVSSVTWKGTEMNKVKEIVSELFDTGSIQKLSERLMEDDILDSDFDFSVKRKGRLRIRSDSAAFRCKSYLLHSSPPGELVSILACQMGRLQGVSAMSLLWMDFVRTLRDTWSQRQSVPFLELAARMDSDKIDSLQDLSLEYIRELETQLMPDMDCCLLHQKLQLLDRCAVRQSIVSAARTAELPSSNMNEILVEDDAYDSAKSEDEYFDSLEDAAVENSGLKTCKLLLSDEFVKPPIKQTTVSFTENAVRQFEPVSASTEASLASNMRAFKNANPKAILADFIRHNSSADWVPFPSIICTNGDEMQEYDAYNALELPLDMKNKHWFPGQGMLSKRIRSAKKNPDPIHTVLETWETLWDQCIAEEIKEKPLFDPVQETEKVFHYLETISPHEMLHQMLVSAIGSCVHTLTEKFSFWCTENEANAAEIPSIIRSHMSALISNSNQAIQLLDAAFAKSQTPLAHAASQKDTSTARFQADTLLQVAFDTALDACWKCIRVMEDVEILYSEALALMHHFTPPKPQNESAMSEYWGFINSIMHSSHNCSAIEQVRLGSESRDIRSDSCCIRNHHLRAEIASLIHLPDCIMSSDKAEEEGFLQPYQREYVFRCYCYRPFHRNVYGREGTRQIEGADTHSTFQSTTDRLLRDVGQSPIVMNRMYASFTKEAVRFALALSESEF